MGKLLVFFLLCGTLALAGTVDPNELKVVPSVELARYLGKWYEVARLPNRFQKNCVGEVTATYSSLPGGQLKVVNACRQANGQMKVAEGEARRADGICRVARMPP